ncbi:LemA family protein [Nanoarchaeota archaeon]
MKKKNWKKHLTWIIPVGILLILLLWVVGSYNGLIGQDENVKKSWANVESTYQRRADLIPNLVATVQGVVDFEQETQTKIAELRTGATAIKSEIQNAQTPAELDEAGNKLNDIVAGYRSLNINVENYPDLKSSQNFLSLQDDLAGTENRINVARQDFNKAVNGYNVKVRRIPTNIIAGLFGFEVKEGFESEEGAENVPLVSFG